VVTMASLWQRSGRHRAQRDRGKGGSVRWSFVAMACQGSVGASKKDRGRKEEMVVAIGSS
jgi:hypothetical protein